MLLIILSLLVIALALFFFWPHKKTEVVYGASFDPGFVGYLGLDWQKTYTKVLDDWGFRYLRLSAHWNEIEKSDGKFEFRDLDWLMTEAAKRQAKVTIALGQKTPRWPECHVPEWANSLDKKRYDEKLNRYITTVVERYKDHPALEIWQVENEPFLPFGHKCADITVEGVKAEIDLVKKLDKEHYVVVTDSGELSTWRKTARLGDLFGTTVYRVVWSKWLGYTDYDWLPANFFRLRAHLAGRSLSSSYIMELQAEPWMPDSDLVSTPLDEQYKSMDILRLKKNLEFSTRLGMSRAYLWGVEWWAWLESKGVKEFAALAKSLQKTSP